MQITKMDLRSDVKTVGIDKPKNIMKSIPKSNIEKGKSNIARISKNGYANDRENFTRETKRNHD